MELWTERQATQYLQHPLTGRDAARSALKAGIAGAPIEVRNALLYEADRVREALERTYDPCRIRVRTDRPIFVARVAPRTPDPDTSWRSWRGADALAPMDEQRDAARAWWHLGDRMWALVGGVGVHQARLRVHPRRPGPVVRRPVGQALVDRCGWTVPGVPGPRTPPA